MTLDCAWSQIQVQDKSNIHAHRRLMFLQPRLLLDSNSTKQGLFILIHRERILTLQIHVDSEFFQALLKHQLEIQVQVSKDPMIKEKLLQSGYNKFAEVNIQAGNWSCERIIYVQRSSLIEEFMDSELHVVTSTIITRGNKLEWGYSTCKTSILHGGSAIASRIWRSSPRSCFYCGTIVLLVFPV